LKDLSAKGSHSRGAIKPPLDQGRKNEASIHHVD
jgi:hypothetical protein